MRLLVGLLVGSTNPGPAPTPAPAAPSSDLLGTAGDIATIAAAVLAALALIGSGRNVWRRTLGRRQHRVQQIQRLGVGYQLGFYESVMGEPAALVNKIVLDPDPDARPIPDRWQQLAARARSRVQRVTNPREAEWLDALDEPFADPDIAQHMWITPECYVEAFVDTATNTVEAFSVTQRDERFSPRFRFPPKIRSNVSLRHPWTRFRGWFYYSVRFREKPFMSVRLGRTRIADAMPDAKPNAVRGLWAMRMWAYTEIYYLGNPGWYLTFVLSASYAGNPRSVGEVGELWQTGVDWPNDEHGRNSWNELEDVHRFRSGTTVTTYGVASSESLAKRIPLWGPHGDEIRMLTSPDA